MTHIGVKASIEPGSSAPLQKVEWLWKQVYADEMEWLVSGATSHVDIYHDHSSYLLVEPICDDGSRQPVGTARLVSDSAAGLPVERFFPLGALKEDRKFIEIQRLIVRPE